MKKLVILAAVICLFSVGALAQTVALEGKTPAKTVSFAGDWELDAKKSKLSEMMRIESLTMKVTQTEKELKVETATKRASVPEGMSGGGRRGGFGDGTVTYSLEGKETIIQQDGPNGPMPITFKAKSEAGKMRLNSSRKFNGPNGEISVTTEETWELADEGKTLKVTRTSNSPRGTQTTEMYFTRK